jgi:hypothetical protein
MNQEDIINDRVIKNKKLKKNYKRQFENEMNKFSEDDDDRDSLRQSKLLN